MSTSSPAAQVRDITFASLPTRKTVIGGGRTTPLVSVAAASNRARGSVDHNGDEDMFDESAASSADAIARITQARASQAAEHDLPADGPRYAAHRPII